MPMGLQLRPLAALCFTVTLSSALMAFTAKFRQKMQRIASEESSGNDLFRDDENEVSIAIGSINRRVDLAFWPAFFLRIGPIFIGETVDAFFMQHCPSRFNSSESSLRDGFRPLQLLLQVY